MKLIVGLLLLAGVISVAAQSGAQQIIKQRAKDLRNQSNARQGVPVAAPATAPQAAPAAPSMQNMARVQADLIAIKPDSAPTEEQKQKLARDLLAAVTDPVKPSAGSLDKLSSELAATFSEKTVTPASRTRLVQELDAVLNPSKYPQVKLDGIYADIPVILDRHGISQRRALLLTAAVKTVAAECRGQKS